MDLQAMRHLPASNASRSALPAHGVPSVGDPVSVRHWLSLAAALALLPGVLGCAGFGEPPASVDGRPSESALQRAASSAANGGNVNVRLVGDVAYVTGRVDSALEENAIKRTLRGVDGVSRVETSLHRNM